MLTMPWQRSNCNRSPLRQEAQLGGYAHTTIKEG